MDHAEGSKQNGGVVNMTRAMEALSPWLNHPRRIIVRVEALVLAVAALLLLQLILGSCRRRWHNPFLKYGLQVCSNKLMDPLVIYALGTMQSSPVKNSHYPVWAGFLVLASMGTTAVQQYDFHGTFHSKLMHALVEGSRLVFYMTMITLLLFPTAYTWDWDPRPLTKDFKLESVSSYCVYGLVGIVMLNKVKELLSLVVIRYKKKKNKIHAAPDGEKEYSYLVLKGSITMDQILGSEELKDELKDELKQVCLSYALFQQLLQRQYNGVAIDQGSSLKSNNFVFEKLLPSQGGSIAAFKTVEVELGFFYDFFFTKYHYTFKLMILLAIHFLDKVILISVVGALAIRKSLALALETPNPIIEVHTSEADHIITLLVLGIALVVELVQVAFYLASNWVQVSLACRYVKTKSKVIEFIGKAIGFLRRFIASGALRKNMDQYSILSGRKDKVAVSDAVKGAIAMSLRSTYGNQADEETSLRQIKIIMFDWTFEDHHSQLEVLLIWHIATEYCDISDDHGKEITRDEQGVATKFSIFWASLTGRVNVFSRDGDRNVGANLSSLCARLIGSISPSDRHRNVVAPDGDRSVAVQLSRYCVYLIGSVPELLPYHEADIAELAKKMMKEDWKVFESDNIYDAVKNLDGTQENPNTIVQKGVKLGKQLEEMAGEHRWKVMKDFWADATIHAAAVHYTTKEHMKRLENGGEFFTHIWVLLAHAGILHGDKGQQGRGVRIPVLRVPVNNQEANLGPGPAQEEIA